MLSTPPAAQAPSTAAARAPFAMRSASAADITRIRALDSRYQKATSVAMDLTKTLRLSALKRERASKGRIIVSKGRVHMEIDSPDRSLLVLDGKTAWLVNYPPADFKDAAIQIVKSKLDSKRARSQVLAGLIAQGGLLKCFKVVGVQMPGPLYFLQPQDQFVEFKRAQARLTPDGKDLLQLSYWDGLDNETELRFSNVRLDVPVANSLFQYVPPKGADINSI